MAQRNQHSFAEEPNAPTKIGSGNFATVYSVRGIPFVFKVIHFPDRTDELRAEVSALHTLYTLCNHDSMFAIPRPIAYYDPATDEFVLLPTSPGLGRAQDPRPVINGNLFTNAGFNAPAYAMDRAHVLPTQISSSVRDLFYNDEARSQTIEPPRMCRLYLGKILRPSESVNSMINFPIDIARYTTLLRVFEGGELIGLDQVAGGMGEMLGRVHWVAGYDGRDIEFVMAGSGLGVRYYVLDFNQMRRFDREGWQSNVQGLIDAFFSNDPYYPRPVTRDHLYQAFRTAYLAACPQEYENGAEAFLDGIEAEQLKRSSV